MLFSLAIFSWILVIVIAWLFFKYVPATHVPLDSLKEANVLLVKNNSEIVWEEHCWEGGEYMEMPFGKTHYYLLGPEDGPKLLFVHGITAASPCFPDFIQGLASAGFRVLTYDLYGRGFSASPGSHYNEGLYTSQLFFLASKLKWTQFHLVGLSLGGAIATCFANQFPEKISTLSLIAPAGLLEALPPIATVLQVPIVGPIIWHSLGRKILASISESNYVKRNAQVEQCIRKTQHHIEYHPGLMRAYYSTVQHFPVTGLEPKFQKLESLFPGKVGVIWGELDKVVSFSLLDKFKELVPSALVFAPKYEGHSICVENPTFCIDAIKSIVKLGEK